jgi:hypothetical protein
LQATVFEREFRDIRDVIPEGFVGVDVEQVKDVAGWVLHTHRLHHKQKKIILIKGKAKCRYLRKFTCKGTLRQVFTCLRPPPILGFCLGQCGLAIL